MEINRLDRRSKYEVVKRPKAKPRKESFAVDPTTVASAFPPKASDIHQQRLMSEHLRFGHMPFDILQQAARNGILPKQLADCKVPRCTACLFSKARKRPWKYTKHHESIKPATKPGQCISVDQLQSPCPGLIPQAKGKLTKRRYTCATVFVDHFSGLDFVVPQESQSAEDTVEAKEVFERFAQSCGVAIRHYHCDNGVFAAKKFRDAVDHSQQTISFCGVNAHHQNGIAERRIQDLSDSTRAMLVEARHRNPLVKNFLWPLALLQDSEMRRYLPRKNETVSPLEKFSRVEVQLKIRHFKPFGCPAYVLSAPLQEGKKQPRWDERARIGIYVGHSPVHSSSIDLILSTTTGLVSPQFHCVFDTTFETIESPSRFGLLWKRLYQPDDYADNSKIQFIHLGLLLTMTPKSPTRTPHQKVREIIRRSALNLLATMNSTMIPNWILLVNHPISTRFPPPHQPQLSNLRETLGQMRELVKHDPVANFDQTIHTSQLSRKALQSLPQKWPFSSAR